MAIHVHGHGRLIADRRAITPDHAGLHVSGRGDQRVAFPPPGREAAIGARSVGRGMRTPIHPDRRHVAIDPRADLPRDQPARDGIEFVPDVKAEGPSTM